MGMEEAIAGGIVGGMIFGLFATMFVVWILLIIARWKIFTKAGEAGWKSIIPIYADYVQWRIGWKKINLFWIMVACVLVGSLLMSLGGYPMDGSTVPNAASMNMPLVVIGFLLALAGGVLDLMSVYKLFQSFGWGVGMFILYIFFAPIILMVLGFGSQHWTGAVD